MSYILPGKINNKSQEEEIESNTHGNATQSWRSGLGALLSSSVDIVGSAVGTEELVFSSLITPHRPANGNLLLKPRLPRYVYNVQRVRLRNQKHLQRNGRLGGRKGERKQTCACCVCFRRVILGEQSFTITDSRKKNTERLSGGVRLQVVSAQGNTVSG